MHRSLRPPPCIDRSHSARAPVSPIFYQKSKLFLLTTRIWFQCAFCIGGISSFLSCRPNLLSTSRDNILGMPDRTFGRVSRCRIALGHGRSRVGPLSATASDIGRKCRSELVTRRRLLPFFADDASALTGDTNRGIHIYKKREDGQTVAFCPDGCSFLPGVDCTRHVSDKG